MDFAFGKTGHGNHFSNDERRNSNDFYYNLFLTIETAFKEGWLAFFFHLLLSWKTTLVFPLTVFLNMFLISSRFMVGCSEKQD